MFDLDLALAYIVPVPPYLLLLTEAATFPFRALVLAVTLLALKPIFNYMIKEKIESLLFLSINHDVIEKHMKRVVKRTNGQTIYLHKSIQFVNNRVNSKVHSMTCKQICLGL